MSSLEDCSDTSHELTQANIETFGRDADLNQAHLIKVPQTQKRAANKHLWEQLWEKRASEPVGTDGYNKVEKLHGSAEQTMQKTWCHVEQELDNSRQRLWNVKFSLLLLIPPAPSLAWVTLSSGKFLYAKDALHFLPIPLPSWSFNIK